MIHEAPLRMQQGARRTRGIIGEASPEAESLKISRLEMQHLDVRNLRNLSLSANAHDEIRIEACEILVGMMRGHNPSGIARATRNPVAFLIAAFVKNLHTKGYLQVEEADLCNLIIDLRAKNGSQPAVTSRFWFSEALKDQGFISPREINRNMRPSMSTPSCKEVLAIIEDVTGVDAETITSGNRNRLAAYARFKAIYVMRHVCMLSLSQIGASIGGRDHTTILNALTHIRLKTEADAGRRQNMLRLCNLADTIGAMRNFEFIKAQK